MRANSQPTFEDHCIISCGILNQEILHLVDHGFLNPRRILFTPPGLHALTDRLEEILLMRISKARESCPDDRIIVVYGKKCFVDIEDPLKRVDTILETTGPAITRVQGEYGYDMLAGLEERQEISQGRQHKVLWFSPGWLRSWKAIYQKYIGWDQADANANFPGYYDKIIVLDGLGITDRYMAERAEDILELFDWTGLEVDFHPITLDRFKGLLLDALPVQNGVHAEN